MKLPIGAPVGKESVWPSKTTVKYYALCLSCGKMNEERTPSSNFEEKVRCDKTDFPPLPASQFEYHVDFEHLKVGDDIGLIYVLWPANPTSKS